jgi:hypothetical protein
LVAGSYQPSAISAASGGATVVVGGGFDTAVFGEGTADGYTLVVGGGFDTSVFGTGQAGGYTVSVGGGDWLSDTGGGYTVSVGGGDWLSDTGGGYSVSVGGGDWLSDTGGGYSVSVGGGDWLSDTGGGYSFVIGGDFDPSVFDPGPGLGPGFNLTDWGLGGTGYGDRTPGSFTPTTYGESMALLVGMAAQNNDWFSMSMLQNIQASMNRTAGVWTLPSGWEYVYSPIW